MKIGSPKESKDQEFRIGLTPNSVKLLVADGHEVWIEHNAGLGIGSNDSVYQKAGALIADSAEQLFDSADLIIKVKEPNHQERLLLKPHHTLFTYLHLASDPEQTNELIQSDAVCIAYETVTDDAGTLPLLTPMSEIAGRLSVQEAASHLAKHNGGMGILLGGATGVEPAHVVIIGGGVVGSNACRIALGLGAYVTILDTSKARLDELEQQFKQKPEGEFNSSVNCVLSIPETLELYVTTADLVVGAVLVPGGAAAKVISSELVKKMKPGSVIADVAIDQGGCCENSKPTTHKNPTFVVDDVIHYCVANIPGAVPKTASEALNNATISAIRDIANKGAKVALLEDVHLRNGLNVCKGKLTRPEVAEALGMEAISAEVALEALA
ncbi:MAG: alanine dehydrogenase [SAR86 cluster bacterium]|uniref:Alanine dehydrogenase n=1 Tax=SAR86 cluster bacterium TaxID=2030880 RepID=A0A2A5ADY9_9GAMM|nr:MAG: alanine dehydrogenase [SAR86 cluster bacterium]